MRTLIGAGSHLTEQRRCTSASAHVRSVSRCAVRYYGRVGWESHTCRLQLFCELCGCRLMLGLRLSIHVEWHVHAILNRDATLGRSHLLGRAHIDDKWPRRQIFEERRRYGLPRLRELRHLRTRGRSQVRKTRGVH